MRSERVGNVRWVRANELAPFHDELRALLLKALGPASVLRGLLSDVPGLQRAFVFGSWARRYEGEAGEAPADIDVLVVGEPAPGDVYAACRRAEAQLGLEVNPVILSEAEWSTPDSQALRAVQRGPLIPVTELEPQR